MNGDMLSRLLAVARTRLLDVILSDAHGMCLVPGQKGY